MMKRGSPLKRTGPIKPKPKRRRAPNLVPKALGEQPKIIGGIEGELLPMGLKTSELTKEEFSELLAYIDHWGTERGVIWTEPKPQDKRPEPPPEAYP